MNKDIRHLILGNQFSSYDEQQQQKNKKGSTSSSPIKICPESSVIIREKKLNLANTQLEIDKLKIKMEKETIEIDQVMTQCSNEHK